MAEDFTHYYKKYQGYFINLIMNMFSISEPTAEDIVQEGFIRVHKGWDTCKTNRSAWIQSVMRNTAINSMNYNNRRDDVIKYMDELPTNSTEDVPIQDISHPEWVYDYEKLMCRYKDILDTLPDKLTTVFSMLEEDGIEYKDIADQLQINRITAKTRVHRVRQVLRKNLNPEE